ncbi:MAG: methylmalonyl-CoA epimerase [Elusimicrobia bacterium]|nr:methylmalonyl-CoA epimerase [Elusimicrobiota bacterium]
MVKKIAHLGIVVRSLDEAVSFYEKVLGLTCSGREEVRDQKVRVAFFACGETRIELIEPVSPDSPVAQFLARRGEGLHHVAFETEDIEAQLRLAKAQGCVVLDEKPREGAGGAKIAFLHPKSTHGVLTEFCGK